MVFRTLGLPNATAPHRLIRPLALDAPIPPPRPWMPVNQSRAYLLRHGSRTEARSGFPTPGEGSTNGYNPQWHPYDRPNTQNCPRAAPGHHGSRQTDSDSLPGADCQSGSVIYTTDQLVRWFANFTVDSDHSELEQLKARVHALGQGMLTRPDLFPTMTHSGTNL